MNYKINVNLKLLSPLSHFGDERLGTMQILRTGKIKYKDEYINVPFYSGNAFRGEIRRLIMRDFLDLLEIKEVSKDLYYMLFTGGSLTSGSRYTEIGERRRMREMCTPLALLGTAIGSQIPAGKLKSALFYPICKETQSITNIESELSFYEMLDEVFYTRRDDLKSIDDLIENTENAKKKKENPVQMKYEQQVLATGTQLTGEMVLENASSLDISCLSRALNLLKENGYIGGKSAAGHGKIDLTTDKELDDKEYIEYVKNNKDSIIAWLKETEEIL